MKIFCFFLITFLSLSNTTLSGQIYLSVIPDSIKFNWNVTEFEIKIINPEGIKKRIRIKASCIDAKGIIIKEKEKDYEMLKTNDTTQMYISDVKCKSINLKFKEGNFWKDK